MFFAQHRSVAKQKRRREERGKERGPFFPPFLVTLFSSHIPFAVRHIPFFTFYFIFSSHLLITQLAGVFFFIFFLFKGYQLFTSFRVWKGRGERNRLWNLRGWLWLRGRFR
ncbi:hypothetical protein B0H65DRAFT_130289 [Neurospora tetraspora]|uniref:Uncharacterized protein n=1 Tax=Neurospora tetraspora TaxID=94610 RepID=A0AAE0JLM1_9PEZI|nr:hypothetical protein B0H65DRAFT_130289 [Neurospora tetraspora]